MTGRERNASRAESIAAQLVNSWGLPRNYRGTAASMIYEALEEASGRPKLYGDNRGCYRPPTTDIETAGPGKENP